MENRDWLTEVTEEHATSCYRPSVISVTVTKGEYPRGGGLYKTSETIGRGVAKLYS